ncbi:MAG: hypothetical protein BRD55_05640 [Bacteroidetes bacterium SW_9_63_38]|nr:MAG: hypothetical protein BRD55_05640 [Bacteroidetes bacterium SW_9_63_38]
MEKNERGNEVEGLFTEKASNWRKKYKSGGELRPRLERFLSGVQELLAPEKRILDFGCGTGDLAAELSKCGYEVCACDFSEAMIRNAAESESQANVKWNILPPDWDTLPYKDSSFDAIVASSVFEYLKDLEGTMRELSRVVSPGGFIIFTVPNIYNRTRKIEWYLRKVIQVPLISYLSSIHEKTNKFMKYIRLSVNRFSAEKWHEYLKCYGFVPLDTREASDEYWQSNKENALILMRFQRNDPS